MPPWLVSFFIVVVFAATVPPLITAAVRRRNRRDEERGIVRNVGPDGSFTVHPRRFQYLVAQVIGIVFASVGVLVALTAFGAGDAWPGPLVGGLVVIVLGGLLILLAVGVRRTRMVVHRDRLEVTRGLGGTRTVPMAAIARVTPWMGNYPGIVARDASGRRLFTANSLSVGYDDLESAVRAHLEAQQFRPLG